MSFYSDDEFDDDTPPQIVEPAPDPLDDSDWKKRPPVGPWAEQAACRAWPRDWWFPIENHETEDSLTAKTICMTCPVQTDCLQHALAAPEPHGIWGGVDEAARARIRRDNLRRSA